MELNSSFAADYRVMVKEVKVKGKKKAVVLRLPEVTLGNFPGAGGTFRLPRIIGYPLAKLMILLPPFVKGELAEKMGLVDKVVPDVDGLEEGVNQILKKGREKPLPFAQPKDQKAPSLQSLPYHFEVSKRPDGTAWEEKRRKIRDLKPSWQH